MDIFNENNTYWEWDFDVPHLVYSGSMEVLAFETGKTLDELYELLGEYEDGSRELQEWVEEWGEAKRGEY